MNFHVRAIGHWSVCWIHMKTVMLACPCWLHVCSCQWFDQGLGSGGIRPKQQWSITISNGYRDWRVTQKTVDAVLTFEYSRVDLKQEPLFKHWCITCAKLASNFSMGVISDRCSCVFQINFVRFYGAMCVCSALELKDSLFLIWWTDFFKRGVFPYLLCNSWQIE